MKPKLESVRLDGNRSLKVMRYTCQAFQDDHGWHMHPEYELSLIIKGRGKRLLGDSIERFAPGDVVFVGPHVPHCWISDDHETENEMMVLQFGSPDLSNTLSHIPEAQALLPVLQEARRGLFYTDDAAQQLATALDATASHKGLSRLVEFMRLLEKLAELPVSQHLASALYSADNVQFHGGRMAKVMAYLKEHLANDIKQTDVAEHVHMTPQGFSRFFKATTGRTFVSFLHTMRITEACRLLLQDRRDIREIAIGCGYANISNFNRRFSEIKGCTPTDYRDLQGQPPLQDR